mmetsp:Transcript_120952/g.349489  ORF Transcript_120952/g.349489 Transcript_120952/m.349489 type:complete len:231 (+) Transcript_120952:1100-1792(+)
MLPLLLHPAGGGHAGGWQAAGRHHRRRRGHTAKRHPAGWHHTHRRHDLRFRRQLVLFADAQVQRPLPPFILRQQAVDIAELGGVVHLIDLCDLLPPELRRVLHGLAAGGGGGARAHIAGSGALVLRQHRGQQTEQVHVLTRRHDARLRPSLPRRFDQELPRPRPARPDQAGQVHQQLAVLLPGVFVEQPQKPQCVRDDELGGRKHGQLMPVELEPDRLLELLGLPQLLVR